MIADKKKRNFIIEIDVDDNDDKKKRNFIIEKDDIIEKKYYNIEKDEKYDK